ncbi:conserved hypothetical protein [Solidesulfovibrio fructosivorans JJ]]|uniref:Uncharacterized protein n=1 Tax=Solidesulfovibrio fructosivorans JJ] TaxID=596151 RepID=E1K086_SOLFR|nr:hypothetical protein [Solidesulfovibrio fructosivorans]EFL50004.1 conserved hypothetical protein [Solidesulfovibrio fructosivorans JJ]]
MSISERMWERAAYLTHYDGSSTADMVAGLANAHAAIERLSPSMGSNVPDNTPHAITTGPILETGLGAILRTRI